MAGLLKDDFSTKRPITQVPAAWFNAVAKILNGITAGAGININKNGTDTAAWEFELDLEYAKKYLGIEDAEKPDDLTHEDITDWDTATADFLDGDDYDAIIEAIGDVSDIVDGILADYLDSGDINVTVAAKNHTHTTANITDWATATADFLTDADMSNYALEADLLTLAEEVTGIEGDILDLADAVEQIDTDLAALEDDFDDLYDALYPSGTKGWVDLTTNQQIGGSKWFTNTVNVGTADNSRMSVSSWSIEMYPPTTSTYGGFIDFHNAGSNEDYTSRVIDDNSGLLLVTKKKVRLSSGSGYYAELDKVPADDTATTSGRIATLGWVNDKFSRKTHHHDDVYAKTDHTHSGYATTNHTHSGYASSNHNHAGVYAPAQHQHVAADITDLGTAIDGKITTFSNTVSTTYATKAALNGVELDVQAIDADLALLELDVQDISDYLETCLTDDDLPAAFITAVASRKTLSNMKVITDLQWTGTALQYKSRSVSYSNGLLTVTGSESSWTTLDTPTVISWS